MNERIKELAKQCWQHRMDGTHFDQELFAQLIIQECVNSVNDTPLFYRDYRDQIEESMRSACAWSIKERFGLNDEE